ncbi:hypothetical protein D2V17_14780 [Aurantiacibacter xanthus]|uniref:Uncharacterized protein n=1 Tax=Aurantiacibacter xanthus TaxID=1784712 RepID=A0A3A1P5H4_9SPHN|nr:DUF6152 family protein [Aurantiacibacter xanthus]RIV82579.1 hypothetical protein D2V17_14780 [Aurantiacibacter xanthus]
MNTKSILLAAALASLPAGAAIAHHSYAAFDMTRSVVINGVVSEVQYANPHAWLFIDRRLASGEVETWAIEAGGPNILMRQGWRKNTVKVGDRVSALIHPGRNPMIKAGSLTALRISGGPTIGTWE